MFKVKERKKEKKMYEEKMNGKSILSNMQCVLFVRKQ